MEETVNLPTEYGDFVTAFTQLTNNLPHLALIKGDISTPARTNQSAFIMCYRRYFWEPQVIKYIVPLNANGRKEGRGLSFI